VNRETAIAATRDDGILRCSVGNEQFAFRTLDVRHIARAEQLRGDPIDDGRVGALTLGGQQVPVFALGRVLGRPSARRSSHADQHIAVTGGRDGLVGWLVDRIARTASPARDAIAPLPRSVGAPASRWFEGLVTFDADDSALLVAPQYLNPLATPDAEPLDTDAAFTAPFTAAHDRRAEPVAVLFSTDSLPPSPARRYALSGRQIAAVVQPTAPIPVPGSAAHVLGVTRWRQSVVPVIEFRSGATQSAFDRRLLIAQGGTGSQGSLIAFAIDSEIMMHRPEADHRLLPDVECPSFCAGMFAVDGDVVGLLDLDALVAGASRAEAV
jgi:chemotaxis signal transduction protein